MAEPISITISSLIAAERLYAYLIAPKLRTKEEQQAYQGITAGEKDPAYWKQEFREAIDEKLEQRIIPLLENQQKILESQARTQEGVCKLVEELVDVSRQTRRRR